MHVEKWERLIPAEGESAETVRVVTYAPDTAWGFLITYGGETGREDAVAVTREQVPGLIAALQAFLSETEGK